MIDSRCGRMLDEGDRSMVSDAEFAWIEEQLAGDYDHLLIGTSLPWLLPRALHDLEAWNEMLATARAARGSRRSREAAPGRRPRALGGVPGLLRAARRPDRQSAAATTPDRTAGAGHDLRAVRRRPPRLRRAGRLPRAADRRKVYQLTCSPLHNYVPGFMKVTFRISWNRLTERSVRFVLGRVSTVPPMRLEWNRLCGPFFGDQIATLTLDGRSARVRFEKAGSDPHEDADLATVAELTLS